MNKYQNIYASEPEDIEEFWRNYPYFNPGILTDENSKYRYQFILLADTAADDATLHEMLNQYLNVKFNPVSDYRSLDENLEKFSELAAESSVIIGNILGRAAFPENINMLLKETASVARTDDIKEMIILYGKQNNDRIRYEIVRKIGLTIMLSRVKNTPAFQKSFGNNHFINMLFFKQLNLKQQREIGGPGTELYYWLDENDKLIFSYDGQNAIISHNAACTERLKKRKMVYELQKEIIHPQITRAGNRVLKYISRVKNKHEDREDYTSVIEKIIRKNIFFPADITDIYGVTFVVESGKDTPVLISEIETFLGGTNTRKNEKIIEKELKEKISRGSGENFKIWKSVYDITLPNEMLEMINYSKERIKIDISQLERIAAPLSSLEGMANLKSLISRHISEKEKEINNLSGLQKMYRKMPFDIYLEVQIQDLNSYLSGKCHGCETEYNLYKHNQVMSSSFYKLFPGKIYKSALMNAFNTD